MKVQFLCFYVRSLIMEGPRWMRHTHSCCRLCVLNYSTVWVCGCVMWWYVIVCVWVCVCVAYNKTKLKGRNLPLSSLGARTLDKEIFKNHFLYLSSFVSGVSSAASTLTALVSFSSSVTFTFISLLLFIISIVCCLLSPPRMCARSRDLRFCSSWNTCSYVIILQPPLTCCQTSNTHSFFSVSFPCPGSTNEQLRSTSIATLTEDSN